MKTIKIILLTLVITSILFTVSISFKKNQELIISYDKKTIEERHGGDSLQVVGDWCMEEVRKNKNLSVFNILPFTYSRIIKNSNSLDCYYIN